MGQYFAISDTASGVTSSAGAIKNRLSLFPALTTLILIFSFGILLAQNATVPGEVNTPYPTITNLAVEWLIKGDDNLNGKVSVNYRRAGEEKWREAMPLRRIPAGKSTGTRPVFLWENKHSGSIFDLKPGTEYEIRLKLSDPDGGSAERIVRVRTRNVPRPALDALVKQVNPATLRDSALTVMPGDILLLSPGYYGSFKLQRDGKPGRPIVLRADKANESIGSTFDSIDLQERRHVIIEGLTVYGSVNLRFSEEVSVRYCKVFAKYGIIAKETPGCKNCYIADNEVTYVMPWARLGVGSGLEYGGAACVGEGIEITGPGNVICHNRVRGFRDCISLMEDLWVYDQICDDIYNNDIIVGADDGVEADFSMGNCRIMRNRITNCGIGLSSQPGLGGPTYFIRNVLYNVLLCTFKLSRSSKGDVVLHNTVIKVGDGFSVVHNPSLVFFRNNLTIGGTGGGRYGQYQSGDGKAIYFPRADSTLDMDYDGVGTCGTPFSGQIGKILFGSLEELRRKTTEKHAVQVDMSVFREKVDFPDPAMPERPVPDLRIKDGSPVVDAGVYLPNVDDGFKGKAPDLGAYEAGAEPPHYGPRPVGMDEETTWKDNRP